MECKFSHRIFVNLIGTKGGLALWWSDCVSVQVLSKFVNLIDTIVTFKSDGSSVRVSWFYGPPKKEKKAAF